MYDHEPSSKIYSKIISQENDKIKNIEIQLLNEIKDRNPKRFQVSVDEFLAYINK